MKRLMMFMVLLLVVVLPVMAQPTLPQIVFVSDGTLQLNNNGTIVPLTDSPAYDYSPVWSPDGTKLMYMTSASDDPFNQERVLYVYDGATSQAVVTGRIMIGIRPSWTTDGRILYMVDTGEFFEGNQPQAGSRVQVYAVAPTANATPELIVDNVVFGVGCGGGSSIPMDWLYWEETDFGGSKGIVALTDFGVVHSGQCVGDKTSLSRPFTGETIALGDGNLARPALSPDRRTVAGVAQTYTDTAFMRTLTLVDLETLEAREIATTDMPDQLAYDAAGNLYYSARVEVGDLLAEMTPEEKQLVGDALGYIDPPLESLPRYEARIYRIAPDGTETLLYAGDGYAIGRMAVSAGMLFFSQVSSGEGWIQGIANGEITLENNFDVAKDYISVDLFALNLNDNSVQLIGQHYQQFAVQPVR